LTPREKKKGGTLALTGDKGEEGEGQRPRKGSIYAIPAESMVTTQAPRRKKVWQRLQRGEEVPRSGLSGKREKRACIERGEGERGNRFFVYQTKQGRNDNLADQKKKKKFNFQLKREKENLICKKEEKGKGHRSRNSQDVLEEQRSRTTA